MCWLNFWEPLLDPVLSLGFIMVGVNMNMLLLPDNWSESSITSADLVNLIHDTAPCIQKQNGTKFYSVMFPVICG